MNANIKSFLRSMLPHSVRNNRILTGPIHGLRIMTSWYDYPGAILGYTERSLLKWFAQNVGIGETWLDVGAHYGYTAIALSSLVGLRGRVFAFEPMVSTAGYLAQTRRLNDFPQLTTLQLALGENEGINLFQLPTVRGMADDTIKNNGWVETMLISSLVLA